LPDPGDVPPILSDSDWEGSPSIATFGWTGFRVPAGVVSPYAKADYVSTQLYDHTSVMKLIEQKWNLPPFTLRDAAANSPLDMVDLDAAPTFLTPPPLAPAPRDTNGKRVSTGIGTDLAPTADEVTYPDTDKMVAGLGKLRRAEFYATRNGQPTTTTTPYYEMLEAAWATS
jgi:phospholipase C